MGGEARGAWLRRPLVAGAATVAGAYALPARQPVRHCRRWNGAQTTLLSIVVVAAAAMVWQERARTTPAEWACAAVVAAMWISPLTLAGELSIYRSESLVVPVVLLVARLPARLGALFAAASAIVLANMTQLFLAGLII